MKKNILPFLLMGSLLAFNLNVLADDQEGNDDGQIDGSELLDAKIALVATDSAPAGAQGTAKLESDNEDGNQTVAFEIKTAGLAAGDYTVSVVLTSDGSTNALGTFTVGGSDGEKKGGGGGDQQGDNNDQGEGDGQHHTNDTMVTESQITLPAGMNASDIAQILISDANGNVVLVGDASAPAPSNAVKFKAKVKLKAGPSAPSAQGMAQLQVTNKKGKHLERFTLMGSGFPPSTTFSVTVNGAPVSSVKSNRKGKLLIHKLPANHPSVRNVRLLDPNGVTSATAKF
jgi:hypothetical protein